MANTIKMIRTDAEGKVTLADVHPAEVENFKAGGYIPAKDSPSISSPVPKSEAVTVEEAVEATARGGSAKAKKPKE